LRNRLKNLRNPDSLNEKEVGAWRKRFVREWVGASGDEKGLKRQLFWEE
jgi:hypothetical protein